MAVLCPGVVTTLWNAGARSYVGRRSVVAVNVRWNRVAYETVEPKGILEPLCWIFACYHLTPMVAEVLGSAADSADEGGGALLALLNLLYPLFAVGL